MQGVCREMDIFTLSDLPLSPQLQLKIKNYFYSNEIRPIFCGDVSYKTISLIIIFKFLTNNKFI